LPGITLLWFLCGIHLLFELDLLKFTPQTSLLGSAGSGKAKRPTGEPEIPVGLQESIRQETYGNYTNFNDTEMRTVSLRDITYSNSLSWLYFKATNFGSNT
jgi:hypothetical protein